MVIGTDDVYEDQRRAEVFDALSHPTRIMILKALSEGALGFADLKKKLGIESSGHLQHHLNKLNGLVKTDEYGKYTLSDQGKDSLLSVETVEKVTKSGPKQNEKAHSVKKSTVLKAAVVTLALLLVVSSVLAVVEYNKASTLQNTIDERDRTISQLNAELNETLSLQDMLRNRDTLITQLDIALSLAQSRLNMKLPLGSQYLSTLPDANRQASPTKICLVSTVAGYHYLPQYPFKTPWFNGTSVGYFSSQRAFELTDNRSIALSFWGWMFDGSAFLDGHYEYEGWGGDAYLMIGVTLRNDYGSADAGNGTDPAAPIGNYTSSTVSWLPNRYGSFVNLTAVLYSRNGSIIPTADAIGLRSGRTAWGGTEFTLGSGETKQVIFYLTPTSLDIDHYEIYVSSLSAYPST